MSLFCREQDRDTPHHSIGSLKKNHRIISLQQPKLWESAWPEQKGESPSPSGLAQKNDSVVLQACDVPTSIPQEKHSVWTKIFIMLWQKYLYSNCPPVFNTISICLCSHVVIMAVALAQNPLSLAVQLTVCDWLRIHSFTVSKGIRQIGDLKSKSKGTEETHST